MIEMAIRTARRCGRKIASSAHAERLFPEFARFLVEQGIDSISLESDAVVQTRLADRSPGAARWRSGEAGADACGFPNLHTEAASHAAPSPSPMPPSNRSNCAAAVAAVVASWPAGCGLPYSLALCWGDRGWRGCPSPPISA